MAMTVHERAVYAGTMSALKRDLSLFARQGYEGLQRKLRAEVEAEWPDLSPKQKETKYRLKKRAHEIKMRMENKKAPAQEPKPSNRGKR